jgi:hypothetical protein
VNVLRDTHRALSPGGFLLDFHPIAPPWARVLAHGEELGELREDQFLDDLRATEAGMREAVRLGLFESVADRTHDIAEHYDSPSELLETWPHDDEAWMSADLERRLRSTTGPVDVVERLVFRLYRRIDRTRATVTTTPARGPARTPAVATARAAPPRPRPAR